MFNASEKQYSDPPLDFSRYTSEVAVILETDGSVRRADLAFEKTLGYRREELLGKGFMAILCSEDVRRVSQALGEVVETPDMASPLEFRFKHKNGSWRCAEGSASNALGDPEVRGLVLTFRDVTEIREKHGALRRSERWHRTLLEDMTDALFVRDVNDTFRYVSPPMARMLGYTPEELLGRVVADLVHPDYRERYERELVEQIHASTGTSCRVEGRYRHRDGHWRRLEMTCKTRIDDPSVQGIVCVARDVTDCKRVEEALRESENRLRLALWATGLGTWDYDVATGTLDWDERGKAMLGASPDARVDLDAFLTGVHADDLEEVRGLAEGAFEKDLHTEYRFVGLEDGVERWIAADARALFDEAGTPYRLVGTVRDVTESKRAEQEIRLLNERLERQVEERTAQLQSAMEEADDNAELLRLSQERFTSLVRHSSDIITMLDAQGTIRYVSPAIEGVLGYKPDELVGKNVFDYAHPRDTEFVSRMPARAMENPGRRVTVEYRFRHKDGTWHYLEAIANNLIGVPGVDGIVINARDVTERKRAEEDLRQTLSTLLALRKAGHILGSTLDYDEVVSKLLEIMHHVSDLTTTVVSVPDERGCLRVWQSVGLDELPGKIRYARDAETARQRALEYHEQRVFRAWDGWTESERLFGLCMPLRVKDRVVGVLEAYGPEAITRDDTLGVLGGLAGQAASALENARLYGEIVERERRLQKLVGDLLGAQEEERKRVAYEVHDGLAQVAAAAHQNLQAFACRYPLEKGTARKDLQLVLGLVRETVSEARRIIANLRPPTLDDLGLASTLALEAESLREEGYEADFEEDLNGCRLPDTVEIAFFRVAQEALTNMRKHSRSDRVRISLRSDGDVVSLEVRDYGRGFEPTAAFAGSGPGERVGLEGMRERIGRLGGRLEINSERGIGTSVVATIPSFNLAARHASENRLFGR